MGKVVKEIRKELEPLVRGDGADMDSYRDGNKGRYNDRIIEKYCAGVKKMPFMVFNGDVYYHCEGYYQVVNRDEYEGMLIDLMLVNKVSGTTFDAVCRATWKMMFSKSIDKVDNGIVCFRNGVVDMDMVGDPNFRVEPHSPKFKTIYKLGYDYLPKRGCPRWKEFLNQVLPDKSLQSVLQEYLGCLFIDRRKTKLEKMLFLYGSGSNGKGVIFETITGLLGGSDNVTNFDIKDLYGSLEAKRNIMTINGKLLNYCSDASSRSILSEMAKSLISGEPQPGRSLFNDNTMVSNIPLLMANTNRLPFTKDASYSFRRRLLIIPFNVTILEDRMDKNLSYKMRSEYSGIMNWILEGRRRFIERNYIFTESDAADKAVVDYFENTLDINYSVAAFMEQMCYMPSPIDNNDKNECFKEQPGSLFSRYREWCNANEKGENTIIDVGNFSKHVAKLGYTKKMINGNNYYIVYQYNG